MSGPGTQIPKLNLDLKSPTDPVTEVQSDTLKTDTPRAPSEQSPRPNLFVDTGSGRGSPSSPAGFAATPAGHHQRTESLSVTLRLVNVHSGAGSNVRLGVPTKGFSSRALSFIDKKTPSPVPAPASLRGVSMTRGRGQSISGMRKNQKPGHNRSITIDSNPQKELSAIEVHLLQIKNSISRSPSPGPATPSHMRGKSFQFDSWGDGMSAPPTPSDHSIPVTPAKALVFNFKKISGRELKSETPQTPSDRDSVFGSAPVSPSWMAFRRYFNNCIASREGSRAASKDPSRAPTPFSRPVSAAGVGQIDMSRVVVPPKPATPTGESVKGLDLIIKLRDEVAEECFSLWSPYAKWDELKPETKEQLEIKVGQNPRDPSYVPEIFLRAIFNVCEKITENQIRNMEPINYSLVVESLMKDEPDLATHSTPQEIYEDCQKAVVHVQNCLLDNDFPFFDALVTVGKKIRDEKAGVIKKIILISQEDQDAILADDSFEFDGAELESALEGSVDLTDGTEQEAKGDSAGADSLNKADLMDNIAVGAFYMTLKLGKYQDVLEHLQKNEERFKKDPIFAELITFVSSGNYEGAIQILVKALDEPLRDNGEIPLDIKPNYKQFLDGKIVAAAELEKDDEADQAAVTVYPPVHSGLARGSSHIARRRSSVDSTDHAMVADDLKKRGIFGDLDDLEKSDSSKASGSGERSDGAVPPPLPKAAFTEPEEHGDKKRGDIGCYLL